MEQKNKTEEFKSTIAGAAMMDFLNRRQILAHNTAIDIINEFKKDCTTFGELLEKIEVFNREVANEGSGGYCGNKAIEEALNEVLKSEPLAPSKESSTILNEESESLDIESILEEMIIEFREKMEDRSSCMNFTISEEIRKLTECLTSVRNHNSIICIQPQMLEE